MAWRRSRRKRWLRPCRAVPCSARILVPKRLGFGRTLNFAHPVSWVLFGAPIAVAVFAAVNKG
jgi:hypothetical protein